MTVEKPKPKQLLRPTTTGAGSAVNQSQFLAITCNSLEARERSRVHGAIGFGFASHWLKNWRESFKPITKRSNRNHGNFRQSFENCSMREFVSPNFNYKVKWCFTIKKGSQAGVVDISHAFHLYYKCCMWIEFQSFST